MIRLQPVADARGMRAFHRLAREVYRSLPHHRATEDEIAHTLAGRKTVFFEHARMELFLAFDSGSGGLPAGKDPVARFALLQDLRRPEYLQIALFEALPGVDGLLPAILSKGRELFPDCRRVVAGLNGHLNYSAGFLASRFDAPPLFGLPYTPPYYLDLFPGLERREMFSFRFESAPFVERVRAAPKAASPVRVRPMDRRNLASEVELYTRLNNLCFQQHPYWADRSPAEDLELFSPFRHFLDDENLLFAEVDGEPVGFLLWYPDFNELAGHGEPLGLEHLLKFRMLGRKPQAMRLTEVAVVEGHRNRGVVPALFSALAEQAGKHGYRWCEGGFVFEENRECVSTVLSSIKRAIGKEPEPYRRYCVFEGAL